jgi:hypothetical protein
MLNTNLKTLEGAIISREFEGRPNHFAQSQNFISESGGYDSMRSLNDLSVDESEDFLKNHIAIVMKASQVSNQYHTAIVMAMLGSNLYWETDIHCFNDLQVDINQTAVIKYAGVHNSVKNNGVMNEMLWALEYYLFKAKKRYSVIAIDLCNVAAVKSFLNAGYIIKAIDKCNPTGTKAVLFKDLEWSLGVNIHLGFKRGGTAAKMRNKNYIANQQKVDDSYYQVDVANFQEIEKMLHIGYYPCDIINNQYVCRKVKGYVVNNIVNIREYADVA